MNPGMRQRTYHSLEITGRSPAVEIWLGDDDGHLVQKEVGQLSSSLAPGHYVVEFTLGGNCYPILLVSDLRLTQDEVEAGPSIERPVPRLG